MTGLRVVAFDLMDTVVRDPYREALEAGAGMPLEELLRRRGGDWTAWPAFERGELTEEAYWRLHEDRGLTIDREAFHRARRAGYRFVPGMVELVARVREQVTCVVASNYPAWIEELSAELLDGLFDAIYVSCRLGVRKPEPAFFEALLERTGVGPHELLFVDDRQANVDAAGELGIRGHRFTGVDDLADRLAAEGLEVPVG